MFEIFENHQTIIYTVFILIFVYNAIVLVAGGKQIESLFPKLETQNVLFRETGCSGRSKSSLLSRLGGGNKVLEVVVTDNELWIKGVFPMFSYIATKFDLLHKVPLSSIKSLKSKGKVIELKFTNEMGEESNIKLVLKNPAEFLVAIGGCSNAS